jgi:dolichol-phosphate mannosyltransferase
MVDLSIIIPCYNEADGVAQLKEELVPVLVSLSSNYPSMELVLVDDGSTDGTWDAFHREFEAEGSTPGKVIFARHQPNRGLGAAIRTGFAAAQGEIAVTTDSDGTYRFDEIPRMLEYLTNGADLVTASPYHPQGEVVGVSAFRLFLSKGSSFLYRILVNWHIHTYTALFRAYRKSVYKRVPFESNGFLAGTELLVNSMLLGFQVTEFPAVLHSRVIGVSKAKIARTIRAHLDFQLKLFLHRLGIKTLLLEKT